MIANDRRKLFLFGFMNVVQGTLVGAIPLVAPSREGSINWVLGAAALSMIAAGPALVFGGAVGRRIALGVCYAHWALGLLLAALVVASAAHMSGLYGSFGTSLAAIATVLAALTLALFWLIPGHEIHFLLRGRENR